MTEADRLKSALATLPAAVAPRVRAALEAVAGLVVQDARLRLPPGPLSDSLAAWSDAEIVAVEATSPDAAVVEYGTVHIAARPFLRPAVEAVSGNARTILGEAFTKAVEASLGSST